MNKTFIETKEYKRFAEFCDACIKYKYIGICYGAPGVGKTLSSRYYCNWDNIEKQIAYRRADDIGKDATDEILSANEEVYTLKSYEGIDLIIVDEIDRLKLQHLEQLRDIYDRNDLAMVLIGMPGIEKRLSRYPQLYSRIGFAHEFDNLSKDETHHILEYKWADLGIDIKLEDFSDYEAITTIIKITKGNFRLIHRLFAQIDRILRINQMDKITVEVVEAARDSLVIGI